jgi:hypothetical protein
VIKDNTTTTVQQYIPDPKLGKYFIINGVIWRRNYPKWNMEDANNIIIENIDKNQPQQLF